MTVEKTELKDNIEEQVKDAVNILHLLMVELEVNKDDQHYLRSVGIVEKMLKTTISDIQKMEE